MLVTRRPERSAIGTSPIRAVLAIGLVIALGLAIPIPGLDLSPQAVVPAEIALDYGPSLFELGLEPLLGVLVLIELVRLAAPRWAETMITRAEPSGRLGPSLVGLAVLVVAAFQAVDLHRAFDETPAFGDGPLLRLAGIASLVAGTALFVWLADRVRLPGLERSGFWVLYALIAVGLMPYDVRDALEAARAGVFPLSTLGLVLLGAVPVVLCIVFARMTMTRALSRSGVDPLVWTPILLWPPVVTTWIVGTLVLWLDRAGFFEGAPRVWNDLGKVTTVATVVLLPAILFLYARAIAQRVPEAARWRGKRVILSLLALQQMALCLVAHWFWAPQAFATQGPQIVAVVVVAHTLWLEMQASPTSGPSRAKGKTAPRTVGRRATG